MNWNQMQVEIKNEVNRVGFRYMADKPASDHPEDWYLRIVLGYRESDASYATWLYNATRNGLCEGHYDMSQAEANEDFLTRN